jgi:hypothetical protein
MTTLSLSTPPNTSVNSYIIHGFLARCGLQYWPCRSPEFNPLDFYLCGHTNDITSSKRVKIICIAPSQFGDGNHANVIPNEKLRGKLSIYTLPRCDGYQSEHVW